MRAAYGVKLCLRCSKNYHTWYTLAPYCKHDPNSKFWITSSRKTGGVNQSFLWQHFPPQQPRYIPCHTSFTRPYKHPHTVVSAIELLLLYHIHTTYAACKDEFRRNHRCRNCGKISFLFLNKTHLQSDEVGVPWCRRGRCPPALAKL